MVAKRPNGNWLPAAFADHLRRRLRVEFAVAGGRGRVEQESFRPYTFGETAGGRNNDGNP